MVHSSHTLNLNSRFFWLLLSHKTYSWTYRAFHEKMQNRSYITQSLMFNSLRVLR